jgi:hypothetical protein
MNCSLGLFDGTAKKVLENGLKPLFNIYYDKDLLLFAEKLFIIEQLKHVYNFLHDYNRIRADLKIDHS